MVHGFTCRAVEPNVQKKGLVQSCRSLVPGRLDGWDVFGTEKRKSETIKFLYPTKP